MNLGWQCPACRRCYAPTVSECVTCAKNAAPVPSSLYPHYPPAYPWPTTVCTAAQALSLDCVGRNDGVGQVSFESISCGPSSHPFPVFDSENFGVLVVDAQ